jgi:hypothetical protein
MSITIESQIHFTRAKAGRKQIAAGPEPEPLPAPPDPIPRVSRLMALAIHFDGLIRQGLVKDYADLARLGSVSRARITQIMNLLNLPPLKQEELLFLAKNEIDRENQTERRARALRLPPLWEVKA